MVRRSRHDTHANHERWILSYADFLTLMFALFVAMYAISMKDRSSAKALSASIRKALESGDPVSTVQELRKAASQKPGVPNSKRLPDSGLTDAYRQLQQQLHNEIQSGAVHMNMQSRGLVIALQEKPFFPSGEDEVNEKTYGIIEQVARTIQRLPNPVRLEGHTDSVPINNDRFHNNWELSTARSIALLEVFQTRFSLPSARFAVSGHADNVPVASNETEEGRMANRRVEIVILNK